MLMDESERSSKIIQVEEFDLLNNEYDKLFHYFEVLIDDIEWIKADYKNLVCEKKNKRKERKKY